MNNKDLFDLIWSYAYSEISPEVTLRPLATSCMKDYKGRSLVQTSFTVLSNKQSCASTSLH